MNRAERILIHVWSLDEKQNELGNQEDGFAFNYRIDAV